MPRVKGYRKKDGTLVRGHARGRGISLKRFKREVRGSGSLSHLRRSTPKSVLDPKMLPGSLEGPYAYRSGWKGRYDPREGRYLGMDDIYMPRDFDPETGRRFGMAAGRSRKKR